MRQICWRKKTFLLLIEPINHFDMPGFHLTGTQQALALIKDIGSDNIKIQYDIYHMQRMEGEINANHDGMGR
ncbi:hydroxypyruvate isomerase [Salmonella enterica subsp. enterica]|uniref:Hydroxypyruvate isomerase n=1 Tax=Salmonella enterica I TaxID=59201 RepID=A0A447U834_SALET|nr:hydroxypyruvate isomerase [Salmonella enterica subsp. enterica]